VAETHIHADFLSGARELSALGGVALYLSDEGDGDWKYEWAKTAENVHLLKHGDTFAVGNIEIEAVHTPGHTPEHLSFLVTDRGSGAAEPMGIATGDFVFVGDLGRPDLLESAAGIAGQMEPSARALHRSVGRFLELPEFVQVWPAHGAGSACGKALGAVPSSTVGYEKRYNASIDAARLGEDRFVQAILDGQPEPPPYFATMKHLNKMGPSVLGNLPEPVHLDPAGLASFLDSRDSHGTVVVDTRTDRRAFMAGHLRGSLLAPLDRTFPTVVGSYVEPDEDLLLVVEKGRLGEAIRDLVRIGFDRVVAAVEPDVLEDPALAHLLHSTRVADFGELLTELQGDVRVLDVRGAAETVGGGLSGALLIPHTRLLPRLAEVPEDRPLWVHCRSGARAAVAAAFLERKGREVVYVDDDVANLIAVLDASRLAGQGSAAAAGAPGGA
ncbi:MAG: MBL fold metallo-hydrolase, partial [Acidobacteriota bacterium]